MKIYLTPIVCTIFLLGTAFQCNMPEECAEPCYQTCLDAVANLKEQQDGSFTLEFENGCTCEVVCTERRKDAALDKEDPLYSGRNSGQSDSESFIYSDTVHIPPDIDPEPALLEKSMVPANKVVFLGPNKSGMSQDKVALSIHDLNYDALQAEYRQQTAWAGNQSFTVRNQFGYYITVLRTSNPEKVVRVGYFSKERFAKRFVFKR